MRAYDCTHHGGVQVVSVETTNLLLQQPTTQLVSVFSHFLPAQCEFAGNIYTDRILKLRPIFSHKPHLAIGRPGTVALHTGLADRAQKKPAACSIPSRRRGAPLFKNRKHLFTLGVWVVGSRWEEGEGEAPRAAILPRAPAAATAAAL